MKGKKDPSLIDDEIRGGRKYSSLPEMGKSVMRPEGVSKNDWFMLGLAQHSENIEQLTFPLSFSLVFLLSWFVLCNFSWIDLCFVGCRLEKDGNQRIDCPTL